MWNDQPLARRSCRSRPHLLTRARVCRWLLARSSNWWTSRPCTRLNNPNEQRDTPCRRFLWDTVIGSPGQLATAVLLFCLLRFPLHLLLTFTSTDLFRSHKQEMFHRVSHARHIVLVTEAPDVHVHSRTSFVRVGIMHQEHF